LYVRDRLEALEAPPTTAVTIKSVDVSYFAQTPDGQRRNRNT